jgi:hypothetical protein
MVNCNNCQRRYCPTCPDRKEGIERMDAFARKARYFKAKQQPKKTSQTTFPLFFLIAVAILALI